MVEPPKATFLTKKQREALKQQQAEDEEAHFKQRVKDVEVKKLDFLLNRDPKITEKPRRSRSRSPKNLEKSDLRYLIDNEEV